MPNQPSIYHLWDRVRHHPDFRFGVVFTKNDLIDPKTQKSMIENELDLKAQASIEEAMIENGTDTVMLMKKKRRKLFKKGVK